MINDTLLNIKLVLAEYIFLNSRRSYFSKRRRLSRHYSQTPIESVLWINNNQNKHEFVYALLYGWRNKTKFAKHIKNIRKKIKQIKENIGFALIKINAIYHRTRRHFGQHIILQVFVSLIPFFFFCVMSKIFWIYNNKYIPTGLLLRTSFHVFLLWGV